MYHTRRKKLALPIFCCCKCTVDSRLSYVYPVSNADTPRTIFVFVVGRYGVDREGGFAACDGICMAEVLLKSVR